jgi:hypothetical protein
MAQKEKQDETPEEAVPAPVTAETLPDGIDADMAAEIVETADQAEVFDQEQLTVPRISLLQDLSPELKERDASYVPGARSGLILNKVKGCLDTEIMFVPAKFAVRYIAWRPRRDGGGLVDQSLTKSDCEENFESDGIGKWIGFMQPNNSDESVKVEVIQTPEWVGLARGANYDWTPVAISFPGTKSKAVRDINTAIDVTRMTINGKRIKPAAFFHVFQISTALDRKGDDEFYNFTVAHKGWCEDPQVRADAKKLKEDFETGTTDVAASG